jgi:hypothetical protein
MGVLSSSVQLWGVFVWVWMTKRKEERGGVMSFEQ